MGWQWAAGQVLMLHPTSGFQPHFAAERFDPQQEYIGVGYPKFKHPLPETNCTPALARQRALEAYQKALQ